MNSADANPNTQYKIEVTDRLYDPEWDLFLCSMDNGTHFQISRWAEVKQSSGWSVLRVKVRQDGNLVGGAQMLLRRLPLVGTIAFISRGPILAASHEGALPQLIDHLCQLSYEQRIQYLLLQPPRGLGWIVEKLRQKGFLESFLSVAPTSVVIIDLRVSEEALHKGMTRRVRRYIRSAERKGITIHEGTEADLPTFLNLLRTTASARGWSIFNDKYYQNMWKTLHPTGNVRLTLASRENEIIAALLIYIHGMNVYGKTLVRTGKHDNSGVHELLLWESIKWAKSYGYRFYDLSKIDPRTSELYQEKTQPLKEISGTADFSKLKFGGSIVHTPRAYAYLYHPVFRTTYRLLFQMIQRLSSTRGLVGNIRGVQNISGSENKLDLG